MRKFLVFSVCIFLLPFAGLAQISMTGPTCVTGEVYYLYHVNGRFDSTTTARICIKGGAFENGDSCYQGKWLPVIKVQWDGNKNGGQISLNSGTVNPLLSVKITHPLGGGTIDSSSMMQMLDSTTTPRTIRCSTADGGSCSPTYKYQWQQSTDNMQWVDVNGAIGQHLSFNKPPAGTTYFRRKVKTVDSDAVAYTMAAIVLIQPSVNP